MSEDEIEKAYKDGQIDSLDAIDRLKFIGLSELDAEALVAAWDDEDFFR